jgi:hypothetical protein
MDIMKMNLKIFLVRLGQVLCFVANGFALAFLSSLHYKILKPFR